eukprot:scaffold1019_cov172-Amphora_coffeaeformis.AAC.8
MMTRNVFVVRILLIIGFVSITFDSSMVFKKCEAHDNTGDTNHPGFDPRRRHHHHHHHHHNNSNNNTTNITRSKPNICFHLGLWLLLAIAVERVVLHHHHLLHTHTSQNMDALGAYGSDDSDDDDRRSRSSAAAPNDEQDKQSPSSGWRWPCPPTTDGASSWIYGRHQNYLAGSIASPTLAGQQQQQQASGTNLSSSLGQDLRAHKEFRNPKHLEQTVERFAIAHPFGTLNTTSAEFAAWEYNVVSLEEQARRQNQQHVAASDFVQDQISRAMVQGHPPPFG